MKPHAFIISQAPYMFCRQSTFSLMWGTAATLLIPLAWGFFCFGEAAAVRAAVAIVAALGGEALIGAIRGRFTLRDGSAVLTGILVAVATPPGAPLYVPVGASLFAILVVKAAFGGLGSNWMNPALGGIAFALLNWPQDAQSWIPPRHLSGLDALSGASPLGLVRSAHLSATPDPLGVLASVGMRFSDFDRSVTTFINQRLFSPLGAELPTGYVDLIVGNRPGTLGEMSGILILAASIILISRRMIRWEIPAAILSSFSILVWIFGGYIQGGPLFSGDVLFNLFNGSILVLSFFMATDPVTSPSSRWPSVAFGLGIGALAFLLRFFSSMPEGTAFAVIIMNCIAPVLARDRSENRAKGPAEVSP
jgi:electron transport complex protein RnfD